MTAAALGTGTLAKFKGGQNLVFEDYIDQKENTTRQHGRCCTIGCSGRAQTRLAQPPTVLAGAVTLLIREESCCQNHESRPVSNSKSCAFRTTATNQ